HLGGFFVSLVSGVVLALQATAVASLGAALVYATGLSLALGTSAMYHRVRWSPRGRRIAQKLDHSMIFVLVGSTYTPIILLGLHGDWRLWGMIAVWVTASGGVIMRLAIPNLPRAALVAAYMGCGWAAVVLMPQLHHTLSSSSYSLLVTGGVLYAVGGFIYLFKRPNPFPRVFGFHEVFHVFVLAAATCHYLAVFDTISGHINN
ncbi:MAG: hemolysin III family protein, partial [Thermoleophilia bacterium]|nr:hemolysin III family protein [Thermoleophilia bacterium]